MQWQLIWCMSNIIKKAVINWWLSAINNYHVYLSICIAAKVITLRAVMSDIRAIKKFQIQVKSCILLPSNIMCFSNHYKNDKSNWATGTAAPRTTLYIIPIYKQASKNWKLTLYQCYVSCSLCLQNKKRSIIFSNLKQQI